MHLRVYLAEKNMKMNDFAASVAVSEGHMYQIIAGRLRASKRLCKLIEFTTKGEVKAKDVLALYVPKLEGEQLDLIKEMKKGKKK